MKTILLITSEESHRFLYERQLKKHFNVRVAESPKAVSEKVDAVIYDLPKYRSTIDFRLLRKFQAPVVVLTPDEKLKLPDTSKRSVLVYPVRMNQLVEALAKLGVCVGEQC